MHTASVCGQTGLRGSVVWTASVLHTAYVRRSVLLSGELPPVE
jgi:hypothetical protein